MKKVIFMGLIICSICAGCSSKNNESSSNTDQNMTPNEDTMQATTEFMGQEEDYAKDDLSEAATDIADDVSEAATDITDGVSEVATDIADGVSEAVSDVSTDTENMGETASDAIVPNNSGT